MLHDIDMRTLKMLSSAEITKRKESCLTRPEGRIKSVGHPVIPVFAGVLDAKR
jgi:hypothetical protein